MSISGIGSYGAGNLSQMLSTLLSELNETSTTTSTTNTDDTTSSSATSSDSNNALTGSTKPSISSMILGMLIGLQQQSSDSASQTSSSSTSSSSSSDPVQTLFSAMDTNGDGTVSQSELENYIEKQGGTQSEADSLYSQLNQSGNSNGISEQQLASEAPPAPPPGPPPGGGMGGPPGQDGTSSSASSTSDLGSEIVQALSSDDSGSVSKSDFENYVTANGGTTAEADTDFSALDTGSSGSLTSSDFDTALQNLQNNISNGSYSPALMFLDALSQNASSANSVSITV